MIIKRFLPLIILSALIIVSLQIGCDKLITEQNYITEAGHPIANFDIDTLSFDTGCAPHTVSFVDKSDGPRDVYLWSFGDGGTSSDTNPVHTYDTAGLYTVSLTIENTPTDGTDTEVKKRYIYVGATNASFTIEGDSTCAGSEVRFVPQIITPLRTYNWDFGDGNVSTDTTPTFSFDSAGFYWVYLTVDDDCGSTLDSSLVTVAECPNIYFKADRTVGCAPLTVTFEDSSYPGDSTTLNFDSRIWNFGNGQSASGANAGNPVVEYDTPGLYTVRLSLRSNDGSTYIGGLATDSIIDFITVYDIPVAQIGVLSDTIACKSLYQPFRVHFDNLTTGNYDSLLWVFGDDDSSRVESPIHEYADPGRYTVQLIVYYDCSSDGTDPQSTSALRVNMVTQYDILEDSSTYFSTTLDSIPLGGTLAYYTFADTSKGLIANWSWDFGDGSPVENTSSVSHSFTLDTDYTVTMTIENGCNSRTVDTTITAGQ